MMKPLFAGCFFILLLLLNVAHHAESRRHDDRRRGRGDDDDGDHRRRGRDDDDVDASLYTLFVFGDGAADNGNYLNLGLNNGSRSWYYPYGVSDDDNHNQPSGRFSDDMVQSDFLAMILGQDESPPPYAGYRLRRRIDPSGMNFANASAAAWYAEPKMSEQVEQFRSLINAGAITKWDLEDSVALVAYSGRDYGRIPVGATDFQIRSVANIVTDEIVRMVKQVQDLGVSKVLVNTMPPYGCIPWTTSRFSNYDHCDQLANSYSDAHNKALASKLGNDKDGVMLLDVNSIVTNLLHSSKFRQDLRPCCENKELGGYCGQYAGDSPQFTLCRSPDEYFYWDSHHPTHVGWKAIMQKLRSPIQDFLDI